MRLLGLDVADYDADCSTPLCKIRCDSTGVNIEPCVKRGSGVDLHRQIKRGINFIHLGTFHLITRVNCHEYTILHLGRWRCMH